MTKHPTTSRRAHKMIDRTTPPGYRYLALYKTSAGIETPKLSKATPDAASVFFCVCYTRHSMAWCVIRQRSYNRRSVALLAYHAAHNGTVCGCCVRLMPVIDAQNRIPRRPVMVTLAGLPKGRPVPFDAGSLNPANVTAPIEIETSSGDSLIQSKEAANMAISAHLNPCPYPLFIWLFAAVSRADLTDHTPHMVRIAAPDELTARRSLVGRYVLSFAGRIPVQEVRHV
ncbi:host cell division inhibitor Icd-like protein [Salmonella enterica subsp. enterica serovar Newport]|nr:host cell division inhibitor Icd-like protein [Salmonella enterica subsp. enterica serovar Newport]